MRRRSPCPTAGEKTARRSDVTGAAGRKTKRLSTKSGILPHGIRTLSIEYRAKNKELRQIDLNGAFM
jgi:hypothetical protein